MKKRILKSNKLVKVVSGISLALLLGTSIFYPKIQERIMREKTTFEKSVIELTDSSTASYLAEKYNLSNYLAQDEEGKIVRFEAIKGVPIDVIVDENSLFCMTDEVKQSIKNAIDSYNKVFYYINPDYQFRYISKADYDKNKTNNPFIFITTNLSIKTNNGYARAVTSPAEPESSKYDNGPIDSSSVIVISSTGTIKLSVEEIQNVVQHEMSHALGFEEHSDNLYSIMNPTSNNATIKSNYFSKDVLLSLFSMYYNPDTNPHSASEVLDFINEQDENRREELNKYIDENTTQQEQNEAKTDKVEETKAPEKTEEVEKVEAVKESEKIENIEETEKIEKEIKIEKTDFEKYCENLNQFAQYSNVEIVDADRVIGKSFSHVNMYGQTMIFTFNEDYTYTLEVFKPYDSIQLTGSYEIENNTIIAKGEYFGIKDFKYVKTTGETSYLSLLSNGGCTFATSSNNFAIESVFEDTLVNSHSNDENCR